MKYCLKTTEAQCWRYPALGLALLGMLAAIASPSSLGSESRFSKFPPRKVLKMTPSAFVKTYTVASRGGVIASGETIECKVYYASCLHGHTLSRARRLPEKAGLACRESIRVLDKWQHTELEWASLFTGGGSGWNGTYADVILEQELFDARLELMYTKSNLGPMSSSHRHTLLKIIREMLKRAEAKPIDSMIYETNQVTFKRRRSSLRSSCLSLQISISGMPDISFGPLSRLIKDTREALTRQEL